MPNPDPIRAAMDAAFLADQHRFVEEFARAHPTAPRPFRTERAAPRVDDCDDCAWEPGGESCSFHADAARQGAVRG